MTIELTARQNITRAFSVRTGSGSNYEVGVDYSASLDHAHWVRGGVLGNDWKPVLNGVAFVVTTRGETVMVAPGALHNTSAIVSLTVCDEVAVRTEFDGLPALRGMKYTCSDWAQHVIEGPTWRTWGFDAFGRVS